MASETPPSHLQDHVDHHDPRPDDPSATLLYEAPTFSIFHKPAGMPISGKKPRTLFKSPLLHDRSPTVIAAVPRPLSGPAIVSFVSATASPTTLYQSGSLVFTFFAIVHCSADTVPKLPAMSITHQNTIPSTSGPLSTILIKATTTGHGLRKQLLRSGAPAVGSIADTRTTRCTTRGVYIACTRLQIPTLGIDVALPVPRKFCTLLEREEHYGRARMTRAEERKSVGADGLLRVRFLDWLFCVDGTMKPRESSEILAKTAAEWLKRANKPSHIPALLDLGTGCGAILISAILQADVNVTGVGVDNSAEAVRVAGRNVSEHGLTGVEIVHADFGELHDFGRFDVVVSNPPYLTRWEVKKDACFFKEEPASALLAGEDGLDGYRAIAKSVGNVLVEDGVLVLETGASRDVTVIRELFEDIGLLSVDLIEDFRGFDRCLVLQNPG